jgi:hypothetical protein
VRNRKRIEESGSGWNKARELLTYILYIDPRDTFIRPSYIHTDCGDCGFPPGKVVPILVDRRINISYSNLDGEVRKYIRL